MRIPLLAGSRLVVATTPEDAVVLRPPPPREAVADVGAAVRDAVRFPLAGEPLETLVTPGGRATIVVEHPSLPIPSSAADPRQAALAAVSDELERLGVASERQTLLVAGGLERRAGRRELERLVAPEFARRFHGRVEVHDVEDPGLVGLGTHDGTPLRTNPALAGTDVAVCVTAAETVLHGGPAALLAAGSPEALGAPGGQSLLETSGSRRWDLALAAERALGARVPVIGLSLVLDHPRLAGAFRGYPHAEDVLERVARSSLRGLFGLVPSPVRRRMLYSLPVELSATGAYAGPPSVAHAEALLRAIEARAASLETKLDAICIAVPPTTAHLPREQPNPLLAVYNGLGLALRLWRDAFPVVEGGTAILLHHLRPRYPHGTQHPYRVFLRGMRSGEVEGVAPDERAIAAYREKRSCHPLLPRVDWEACRPARERLGAVIVAGCRDATAARRFGFVPTHGLGAALEMARGRAGGDARIGFLVAPPYFPLQVG